MASDIDFSGALYSVDTALSGQIASLNIPTPKTLKNEDWPPDYKAVIAWRQQRLDMFERNPQTLEDAKAYYSLMEAESVAAFINHWCWTYDPRNAGKGLPVWMPFILFERQYELVEFIMECIKNDAPGLVEKSRDMGATWVGIGITVALWLFHPGFVTGWGSNKQEQVDVIGNPKSIFEKIRLLIDRIPDVFKPDVLTGVHLKQYTCQNPVNGAVIDGEIGRNIGRGGRSRVYFVDEAAHLEHPEAVEASLSENTRCRIDLSSVSGPGTVFHRTREAGQVWRPGMTMRRDVANVFEMDRTDHPEKTDEWYRERRTYFEGRGLAHVVAREIDRDYFAALEGVIIEYKWVEAAVDAHEKLGFEIEGGWSAALDVADEGVDTNALCKFKGVTCMYLEEWGERDIGVSARKALAACKKTLPITMQYDCIGLGAGVKAEVNRLRQDEKTLPQELQVVAWHAGARVMHPGDKIIEDDEEAPTNRDAFANFKAQAWWNVAQMFYRTHLAVTQDVEFDPDELISLNSKTIDKKLLSKLKKELCQAAMVQDTRTLKMRVDKAPEGARSPNLADAIIMCRYPARADGGPSVGLIGPKVFIGGQRV